MHDYWDWRLDHQDIVKRADGRYLTDVWTDEAVSFVERHEAGGPFFLSLNYNAPHTPLQAPEEDVAPFLEGGRFDEGIATLYGMIRRMDSGVARVLDALDRTGQKDNTVVVFTSDNGPQFGTVSNWMARMFGRCCRGAATRSRLSASGSGTVLRQT